MCDLRREWGGAGRSHPRRNQRDRAGGGHEPDRLPPRREHGAEGRTRGAHRHEGNGRAEPAPRHLERQEIHQPPAPAPRTHPRNHYTPDTRHRPTTPPPRPTVPPPSPPPP